MVNRRSCRTVFCLVLLVSVAWPSPAAEKVTVLQSGDRPGHYLTWKGKPRLLIGDSVTQGWMESGENFDHRAYIDALAERGINLLMLWAFKGTSAGLQQQDARIRYDAPESWPWAGSPDDRDFDLRQLNPAYSGDEIRFAKWSKIELSFRGPASLGRGEPNPFAVKLDVDFRSPGGRHYCVPGFYDGDGRGGLDGAVWKVRFSADEIGSWTYTTSSDNRQLNGKAGQFTVTDVTADAEGLWRWGRLEAEGTAENGIRYLKFRDGPYWLKAGCDDPENFLGNCKNYDTLTKRKAAVDYLAERGINSLYMMTNNIDGDDKDVWPWLGLTPREAKVNSAGNVRFDVARWNSGDSCSSTCRPRAS